MIVINIHLYLYYLTAKALVIHLYMFDQIDLGTEDRHCFCKASDLLAVVE